MKDAKKTNVTSAASDCNTDDALSAEATVNEITRLSNGATKAYVRVFGVIDSTNSEARRAYARDASVADGYAVFVADGQTEGRGRMSRRFYSPEKTGVYMSVMFKNTFPSDRTGCVTPLAAVAVSRTLETVCGVRVGIKWVNDVYIDRKKVCGILTEGIASADSGELETLIVGVGINLCTVDFPDDLKSKAGAVCKGWVSRTAVIGRLVAELDRVFKSDVDATLAEYSKRMLGIGEKCTFKRDGRAYEAKVLGIDRDAGLLVECGGKAVSISYGEVSFCDLPI